LTGSRKLYDFILFVVHSSVNPAGCRTCLPGVQHRMLYEGLDI
jgi:hypothetical protein